MYQRLLPVKLAGYRSYPKNPFNIILLHEQRFEAALYSYILLIVHSASVVRSVRTIMSNAEGKNRSRIQWY